MAADVEQAVKVLYDYTYSDEAGLVEIRAGDVYVLVEKTNEDWWQVLEPEDDEADTFFVPAQYVQVIPWSHSTSSDRTTGMGDGRVTALKQKDHHDRESGSDPSSHSRHEGDLNQPPLGSSQPLGKHDTSDGGGYVNLDQYRQTAGINNGTADNTGGQHDPHPKQLGKPPPLPPKSVQAITHQPSIPEDGKYLRALASDSPWDVYKDGSSGRLFYVNRETRERAWKAPRKVNSSPENQASQSDVNSPRQSRKQLANNQVVSHQAADSSSNHVSSQNKAIHEGHLYVTKIQDVSRKKAKKSWNQLYVVLQGSNLFFYKDQKSATQKQGCSFGKPEAVVSLQAAQVDLHPRDVTNKKNTFMLRAASGNVYLFQAETEVENLEWFTQIKLIANDISPSSVKITPSPLASEVQGTNKDRGQSEAHGITKDRGQSEAHGTTKDRGHAEAHGTTKDRGHSEAQGITKDRGQSEVHNTTKDRGHSEAQGITKDRVITKSSSIDDNANNILHVDRTKNMIRIRDKLFKFISIRPSQDDLYKRGIMRDAVFGSKLHELCDREQQNVPDFVHSCIAAIETKGLNQDGLYRISGNMAEIQRLRFLVDSGEPYNLYQEQWDVHVLTGALKLFFRELQEPVLTFRMYDRFTDAIKKSSRTEQMAAFKSAVSDLPRCNYATLKEFFQHLSRVMGASHKNRMQSQNLSIVFGPTLLWQQNPDESLAVQTVFQNKVVEFLLQEFNQLFY